MLHQALGFKQDTDDRSEKYSDTFAEHTFEQSKHYDKDLTPTLKEVSTAKYLERNSPNDKQNKSNSSISEDFGN